VNDGPLSQLWRSQRGYPVPMAVHQSHLNRVWLSEKERFHVESNIE
jgi:hypothetical protein